MSEPVQFFLYRLTRTEETYPGPSPIRLALLDLDVKRYPQLAEVHPFFKDELWFEVGQTKVVPLPEGEAARLATQGWKVERRAHGHPVNDSERALIAFCERRHVELAAAKNRVLSYTDPYGDYVRAGLVARYPKTAEIGDELEGLRALGFVSDEVAEDMGVVSKRLLELRADLEAKGWQFDSAGRVWEPSSGGRPAKYPREAIRAHYRQLASQYTGLLTPNSTDEPVVGRIRSDLAPIFGDLSSEEIREAIKYEAKRQADSTPPPPDGSP